MNYYITSKVAGSPKEILDECDSREEADTLASAYMVAGFENIQVTDTPSAPMLKEWYGEL